MRVQMEAEMMNLEAKTAPELSELTCLELKRAGLDMSVGIIGSIDDGGWGIYVNRDGAEIDWESHAAAEQIAGELRQRYRLV